MCTAAGFEPRTLLGAVTGLISTVLSAPNQRGHALAKELVHLSARQRQLPIHPTGAKVADLDQPSSKRDPAWGSSGHATLYTSEGWWRPFAPHSVEQAIDERHR